MKTPQTYACPCGRSYARKHSRDRHETKCELAKQTDAAGREREAKERLLKKWQSFDASLEAGWHDRSDDRREWLKNMEPESRILLREALAERGQSGVFDRVVGEMEASK